jgi:glycosyltransferase involved in cell wall biosynthesis
MPLCSTPEGAERSRSRYKAIVAVPAFNAMETIGPVLASIVQSIRYYGTRHETADRIAMSITDDASTDQTVSIVASFAQTVEFDVYLTVNATNCGRGCSRNRALAVADAECYLFLDHDDEYLPEHIAVCLDALAHDRRADFVKTGVHLSNPVHADWEPRIAASLTQNLCVRAYCNNIVGGFHEEPEVETYGCDDVLYNRTLRACFRGIELPERTVKFLRRPGNSFDRQYERKFSRPTAAAQVTLSPLQQRVAPLVQAIHDRRLGEARTRMRQLAALTRVTRRAERRF